MHHVYNIIVLFSPLIRLLMMVRPLQFIWLPQAMVYPLEERAPLLSLSLT